MFKIAVVEDEKNLANLVVKYLEAANYEVYLFHTGEEAIKNLDKNIDLWVLDIMLPGEVSGFDLLKTIKIKEKSIPVIFTSARDKDIDKIMGLELGGDDYLAKPYSIRELVLRVKKIISRTYQNDHKVAVNKIIVGDYEIDKERRAVYENGQSLQLTSKEYDLLIFFVNNNGIAFSRNQILNEIWGLDYFGSDRVVDDLLRRLRQKLPKLNVETIYGFGYRLAI